MKVDYNVKCFVCGRNDFQKPICPNCKSKYPRIAKKFQRIRWTLMPIAIGFMSYLFLLMITPTFLGYNIRNLRSFLLSYLFFLGLMFLGILAMKIVVWTTKDYRDKVDNERKREIQNAKRKMCQNCKQIVSGSTPRCPNCGVEFHF